MEFAVIDIETTGATSVGGKITEIAIVITDGKKIIDTYETLVNPEQKIPYFISRLTGITDDMVKDAPKFYEIAKDLIQYTEGRVFVAHNSAFDYGFFKKEFKDLGYSYERKTICTVKSSRKVFPGLQSYSLGKIAGHFGIEIKARHRAMGDAEATAHLFHKMVKTDDSFLTEFTFDNYLADELKVSQLPNEPGIYYLLNRSQEIIYIGKSKKIKTRIKSHLRNFETKKGVSIIEEVHKINFLKTGNEIMATLYENKEIKKHQPKYNHAQKNTVFPFGIYLHETNSPNDYYSLTVASVKDNEPLIGFKSLEQAKEKLREITENYGLCEAINNLEKHTTPKACFGYQIEKCKGACIAKEDPKDYNKRFKSFLKQYGFTKETTVFVSNGLKSSQKAFVLLLNGYIKAFGYADAKSVNFKSPEQLLLLSEPFENDKDYQVVIKHLFQDKRFKQIKLTEVN